MSEDRHPPKVPRALAGALRAFAAEHDLPNAVSPKELHEGFGGPFPLEVGWHWLYNKAAVERECASVGIRIESFRKDDAKGPKLMRVAAL